MTPAQDVRQRSTKDLLVAAVLGSTALMKAEVELAMSELRADLHSQLGVAVKIGIAALSVLLGLSMLLVTLVLALAPIMRPWLAALILAAGLFAIAGALGAWGWSQRLKEPLPLTRRSVKEGIEWVKERVA